MPLRLSLGCVLLGTNCIPSHEVAAERKEGCIDSAPDEKDAEIQADSRVQVEEDLTSDFDD